MIRPAGRVLTLIPGFPDGIFSAAAPAIPEAERRRRFHKELAAARVTPGRVCDISGEKIVDDPLGKLHESPVDDEEKRLFRRFTGGAELRRRYPAGCRADDKAPFGAVFAEINTASEISARRCSARPCYLQDTRTALSGVAQPCAKNWDAGYSGHFRKCSREKEPANTTGFGPNGPDFAGVPCE